MPKALYSVGDIYHRSCSPDSYSGDCTYPKAIDAADRSSDKIPTERDSTELALPPYPRNGVKATSSERKDNQV